MSARKHRRLHDVVEPETRRVEDRLRGCAARARPGPRPPRRARRVAGSMPELARAEHHVAAPDRLAVRPDRGRRAAGRDRLSAHSSLSSLISIVVAATNGGSSPGIAQRPPAAAAPDRLGGRRLGPVERRIERPERRPGARQPDRAVGQPRQRPAQRARGPGRRPRRPAAGRWPRRGRRPARGTPGRSARSRTRSRSAPTSGGRRRARAIAPPDQAANTAAVWAGIAGVTSRTPGGSVRRRRGRRDAVERRDPLAAPLDQRGAAGRGRTGRRCRGRARSRHAASSSRSAPHASSAAPTRRGGVARSAGEARPRRGSASRGGQRAAAPRPRAR